MKNLLKIDDLRKELYTGDLGDRFCDYDNGYICDIITEIADNAVDIYTSDLLDWARNNYEYIDEATEELGRPDDFLGEIRQGQFLYNEHDLYDNLEDSLKYFAYTYIERVLDLEEITEEQNENLLDYDFDDNNDTLENLIDHIEEVFETEDNED